MSKLNLILIIGAVVFIIGGFIVLSSAPQKKALDKHMNMRIKQAKKDLWKYRV